MATPSSPWAERKVLFGLGADNFIVRKSSLLLFYIPPLKSSLRRTDCATRGGEEQFYRYRENEYLRTPVSRECMLETRQASSITRWILVLQGMPFALSHSEYCSAKVSRIVGYIWSVCAVVVCERVKGCRCRPVIAANVLLYIAKGTTRSVMLRGLTEILSNLLLDLFWSAFNAFFHRSSSSSDEFSIRRSPSLL